MIPRRSRSEVIKNRAAGRVIKPAAAGFLGIGFFRSFNRTRKPRPVLNINTPEGHEAAGTN